MKNQPITQLIYLLILTAMGSFGMANSQDQPLDKAERKAVVEAVSTQLKDNYIFPELANKMAKTINKNLKKGQYQGHHRCTSFCPATHR